MSPEEFNQRKNQATAFIRERLPAIVGTEAVRHSKESFHNEGFTDESLEKWPDISEARKKQKRTKSGAMKPILTDSADLGDSITWSESGDTVTISTDVPYAQRHNEGTNGMPQRQFMGPSKQLDTRIMDKLERELDKIFR